MSINLRYRLLLPLVALIIALPTQRALADEAAEQAVWLLQKSTLVHRNGFHKVLLSALRQMKDPKLAPLFSELIQRRHPDLKISGILAMGEVTDPPSLDLALLSDIKDTGTQVRLVSAAIDSNLLTVDDAKQVLRWPGLDPALQVLVVGMLVAEGEAVEPELLDEAMQSENIAMRATAATLLMQIGKPEAIEELEKLSASDAPRRDHVRSLVLQMAMKYEFENIGPWARKIVDETDIDRAFHKMAMLVSLKFKAPGATDAWAKWFDETSSAAERIRLAMLVLEAAEAVDAKVFDKLVEADDALLKAIGKVGVSIANGKPDLPALVEFLKINDALAGPWALQYAQRLVKTDTGMARELIATIIGQADADDERLRARRLQHAVIGTQILHEEDPDAGETLVELLRGSSMNVREAMLIGLIRSAGDRPDKLIEGMTFESRAGEAMALLLRVKHADQLTDEQHEALSLVVRGGAGLSEPLRIQAAWTYLKLTSQDNVALAKVLGKGGGS